MKKNTILTKVCALLSVLAIGGASGCSALESLLGGSSAGDSTQVESSVTSGNPVISESPSASEEPEDSEDVGTSEDPTTSETPETSEDPTTSETPETPEYTLAVTAPTGEVVPYATAVREYLEAGAGAKVGDYYQSMASQYLPVEIKWNFKGGSARKFIVEYATKSDFSDAITTEMKSTARSMEVYNLYKGTTYYVRITAYGAKNAEIATTVSTFETTDLGPRFMYIEGEDDLAVYNVRDLGGYTTTDGKTLVQGIAYRSGSLVAPPNNVHYKNNISEAGKTYMSEVMGIKTEIDFRTEKEAGVTLAQGSVIPGATLSYVTLNGYGDTFQYDDEYKAFFTMLADENNYPMIMHCTGGADRTGSVVYLLHTMLGVSELECLQGYELTSFSHYGLRDTKGDYKDYWDGFMTKLNTYAGNTKQEKVETWMKTVVGITQAQIDKIKGIFYGEIAVDGAFTPTKENTAAKAAKKMYSDSLAAWAVQKKED